MEIKLEKIASNVIDSAFTIHRALGPGLLESVYELLLQKELEQRGYQVKRQHPIPVEFNGLRFDEGFKADLWIDDCFIVELKSVEKSAPVHSKQLLTYLVLSKTSLGLLINFGESLLKDGIKRIVKTSKSSIHKDIISRNDATPQR